MDPPASSDVSAHYDRWAATYDTDSNRTRDRAAEALRAEGLELAGRHVIELGCGTGVHTRWLAARARAVTALDFSRAMLGQAQARVREDSIRFVLHDVHAGLPFRSRSADVVIAMLVLEHVTELAPVIEECARVLRPGGDLFLCELHPYRQRAGSRAEYADTDSGRVVRLPATVHDVSEFVMAGIGAGLTLVRIAEWLDDDVDAARALPRVLSLRFGKPGPPAHA